MNLGASADLPIEFAEVAVLVGGVTILDRISLSTFRRERQRF